MNDLQSRLKLETPKNQLQLIQELATGGEAELNALMDFLLQRREGAMGLVEGKAYQVLFDADTPTTRTFLQTHFPQGIVPLRSDRSVDYSPLQLLLAKQDFQMADRITLEKMCELAGPDASRRKWLYFTEVDNFPTIDLQTINSLWVIHSEGRFGFSVQRELWIGVGRNWERLWPQIGWRSGSTWTRYPNEFTWNLTAPRGHLPLTNQLRGVRVMAALMAHPAWTVAS